MFNFIYKDVLRYREYEAEGVTNTPKYKAEVKIKGLRIRGSSKYTTTPDGDTVTCNVVFRTPDKLVKNSKLEGYTIIDVVRVDSILRDAGYLVYVK